MKSRDYSSLRRKESGLKMIKVSVGTICVLLSEIKQLEKQVRVNFSIKVNLLSSCKIHMYHRFYSLVYDLMRVNFSVRELHISLPSQYEPHPLTYLTSTNIILSHGVHYIHIFLSIYIYLLLQYLVYKTVRNDTNRRGKSTHRVTMDPNDSMRCAKE